MKSFVVGLLALSAIACGAAPVFAQGFEVGPGGVRIYPDRPRAYDERYDGRRGYDDRRGYGRPAGRGYCARLRDACENGPRGEGNCRRYRDSCG